MSIIQPHTLDDLRSWEQLPENSDKQFELLGGVIYKVTPPKPLHNYIVSQIVYALMSFIKIHPIGWVFGDSTSYRLSSTDEFVPDASFIAGKPDLDLTHYFYFAPDLAIEVVSPANTPRQLMQKIETYIMYGTRLVWVIYPEERVVEIWRSAGDDGLHKRTLMEKETLTGEDVLPNFVLAIADLFPKARA
ncbi:MAG: Uma2 family endonuclease [Phototrophicales bacterium]|nr:Uma2 family endonuclease [Phototrophicales bacterium]